MDFKFANLHNILYSIKASSMPIEFNKFDV